jgi:pyrimidine-specific ribonucleoside hydrolase
MILVNPESFKKSPLNGNTKIRYNTGVNIASVKEILSDMIAGDYKTGHFLAFYGFPVRPELYVYDVRQIMDSAIARYGIDEWKACVMTDEFHGHLGVFSIVGAKMGILAREYFGIGTDLLEIYTYAGSEEPLSCMIDGLQVSTGATLGQGSIYLVNEPTAKPQAIFTYNGKSIFVKLKPEYLRQLQEVINEGVRNYGLQDEDYWTLVRQTTLKFWLEWDRKKIFEMNVL